MGYTPPYLEVRVVSGGWKIYPPTNTTTDDLFIYPNGTDVHPFIGLYGAGILKLDTTSGQNIEFSSNGTTFAYLYYTGTDSQINTLTDKNLYLKPNGTGKVKFGTYTAGAATDSTGYIDILDAAGNARKLMVQA